jgi:stage II sporulation protein D
VRDGELKRSYPGLLHVTLEVASLKILDEVDVEDYLSPVVESEASGAKGAALEAQAVVSRTFALASRRRHGAAGYDLCDLAHCQVYRGRGESSEASRAAVQKTRGQVLLTGSVALKPAFFHAACGGHTSSALDVFGEEAAGDAVSDVEKGVTRCHGAPDFAWTYSIDRPQLAAALGFKDEGNAIEVLRRDAGGRILELKIFGRRLSAGEFLSRMGRAVGWSELKSARFTTEEIEGVVHFKGSGRGHGVGLCQEGAKWLADQGVDATGILLRYFPGARLAPAP